MLYAKFQNHRPSGSGEKDFLKVFAIYSHGSHLGHVTLTIYTNVHCPFLTILQIKFGFDLPSSFRADEVCILWPWGRADNLGTKFFHKHKYPVHLPISCKFFPSNHILTIFPIQMHGRPILTLP